MFLLLQILKMLFVSNSSTMAIVFAYLLNTLESRRTQYIPRRIYVDAYFEVLHGGIVLKVTYFLFKQLSLRNASP